MLVLIATLQATLGLLAGGALLTLILLKRSYRYFGRQKKGGSAPIERVARPASQWDGAQRDALAQVERQKVEMHEMSRDLNGQLSSRIIVLERLIGDSQRQIERLEALLAAAEPAAVKTKENAVK
jgi:hypothetical protein